MSEYFYVEPASTTSYDSIKFRFIGYGMTIDQMPSLQYKVYYSWQTYNWTTSGSNVLGDEITVYVGDKIRFKGINDTFSPVDATDSKHIVASSAGSNINVGGNLSSLLVGDNMAEVTGKKRCFLDLFAALDYVRVVDASNLVCDVSGQQCYQYLFYNSPYLIKAPKFSITAFDASDTSCCDSMFYNCSALTTSPTSLPATTLAQNCYSNMFNGCTSLTSVPSLPATTLAQNCYSNMFNGCTSLTSAPALPATTLAQNCYSFMFYNCTNLTNIPELPATTLATGCYLNMFKYCTNLTNILELPATTIPDYAYYGMFYGCTSIKLSSTKTGNYKKAYRIPITGTGATRADSLTDMFTRTGGTFAGTPTVNTTYYTEYSPATFYIEAIEATTIQLAKIGSPTVGDCTYGINDNTVPNSYTYGTNISLTAGQKCYFRIDANTTDFDSSNYLKFTSTGRINVGGNISDLIGQGYIIPRTNCFLRLFEGLSTLVSAENLALDNIIDFNSKSGVFCQMFKDSGVKKVSSLPTCTFTNFCFSEMFLNCTNLFNVPELPSTQLSSYCYQGMFSGCTNIRILPNLPATTIPDGAYCGMFMGCTSIALSDTQTGNYQIPFRIPYSGTGTCGSMSLDLMFTNTGGTFTGTPSINTTYYLNEIPFTTTFYIEAVSSGYLMLCTRYYDMDIGHCYYGTNPNSLTRYTWNNMIGLTAGQKYYFAIAPSKTNSPLDAYTYIYFNIWGTTFKCAGELNNLNGNLPYLRAYAFNHLFNNSGTLIDASNLILPTLTENDGEGVYYGMFSSCNNLINSPASIPGNYMPALGCYEMFEYCRNLITAPTLPATNINNNCYYDMFGSCTSLIVAPDLPAQILKERCYSYMFAGCTSLTNSPNISATTTAISCCDTMFSNCTSLKTLPKLYSTQLAERCYSSMFYNCSSIKLSTTDTSKYKIAYRIPDAGSGAQAWGSTSRMFYGTGGTFTDTPSINTTYYVWDYDILDSRNKPYLIGI